jgi:hypothetical protein
MAFIQSDKLLDDEQQQGQAPNQGGSLLSGGSSNDVGAGVSTAGVGSGGTGGWTNIQAYLNANKGDTGSSQLLNNTVGNQFNTEKQKMGDESKSFLDSAQKQVNDSKISNDQANDYINQAAKQYSYQQPGGGAATKDKGDQAEPTDLLSYQKVTAPYGGGFQWTPQTPGVGELDYDSVVSRMKGALNNAYSGPSSYNYEFGADTQKYGQDLKDNGGFDQLMSGLYSRAAGSPLTGGMYQLQKQLDVNNSNLIDARQKLLAQYAGLEGDRDKTVQDTTAALGSLADQYRSNQTALRDYLGRKANDFQTSQDQAEADARAAFQNTFKNDHSIRGNTWWGVVPDGGAMQDAGIWGGNLTWSQLQNEQDIANDPSRTGSWFYNGPGQHALHDDWQLANDPAARAARDRLDANASFLNRFYNNEDQKYANTADEQKRSWNAIQDFLDSTAARKQQGFKVRG